MPITNGESACLFAEALGLANLTRLSCTSAPVAASGESCYCEQAVIDRKDNGQLVPCAPVDPYTVALARWFGVSNGEVETILRDP